MCMEKQFAEHDKDIIKRHRGHKGHKGTLVSLVSDKIVRRVVVESRGKTGKINS